MTAGGHRQALRDELVAPTGAGLGGPDPGRLARVGLDGSQLEGSSTCTAPTLPRHPPGDPDSAKEAR